MIDDCSNRVVNLIIGLTPRSKFWANLH